MYVQKYDLSFDANINVLIVAVHQISPEQAYIAVLIAETIILIQDTTTR